MKLSDSTLKAIVISIENYFVKQGLGDVIISPPYLGDIGDFPTYDYSGLILIHGDFNGAIYCTSKKSMLAHVLNKFNYALDEENMLDLIGEMANIFAGNVRSDLGENFQITPPIKVSGSMKRIKFALDDSPYILPIKYNGEECKLVVSFEKSTVATKSIELLSN